MKKILALLLVAVLALSLFSCNRDKDKDKDEKPDVDISLFTTAIAATTPAKQTIDVVQETAIEDLSGHYEITYKADGSAVIDYSYEELNTLASGKTEPKSTVTGSVTRDAAGNYSGSISGTVTASAAINFNLASVNKDCIVEGNPLSVKVAKDNTATVFGTAYESDVSLVLTVNEGKVASFNLTYTAAAGKVSVASMFE